jgi:hypothetical protein
MSIGVRRTFLFQVGHSTATKLFWPSENAEFNSFKLVSLALHFHSQAAMKIPKIRFLANDNS